MSNNLKPCTENPANNTSSNSTYNNDNPDFHFLKSALDHASANIMMAGPDRRIMYANRAVIDMLKSNEARIRESLPAFSAEHLIGRSIDEFHKNPHQQASRLDTLTSTFRSRIKIGDLNFNIIANPIFDKNGNRLGTSVEWRDVTQELKAQEGNPLIITD